MGKLYTEQNSMAPTDIDSIAFAENNLICRTDTRTDSNLAELLGRWAELALDFLRTSEYTEMQA
jgi:hypothetical protein